jgi:hypothetical protein
MKNGAPGVYDNHRITTCKKPPLEAYFPPHSLGTAYYVGRCVDIIIYPEGRTSSRSSAMASNRNKPFAGSIIRASFYYMDKFVLLVKCILFFMHAIIRVVLLLCCVANELSVHRLQNPP